MRAFLCFEAKNGVRSLSNARGGPGKAAWEGSILVDARYSGSWMKRMPSAPLTCSSSAR